MKKQGQIEKEGEQKSKSGFTLVEFTFGAAIFAIAVFGTIALLGESLSFGKFSNSRMIAMNETRRVLEEIRYMADTDGLANVADNDWTAWANQNLNNPLENQAITVTDLQGNPLENNADPLPVRVSANWTEKGKTTVYAVETLVTKR